MDDPRSDWFEVGDPVEAFAVFRDRTGTKRDPLLVTCRAFDPDGNETTLPVTRESLGTYRATATPMIPGVWRLAWHGQGDVEKSGRDSFLVREPVA